MTSFNEREDTFEKKFALDEELQFKAEARRNRMLGLWVANLMGKTGEDAEAYAKTIILSDFEEPGDEDVFRKLRADLDAANIDQSDHQIRRQMETFLAQAIEDIKRQS